MRYNSIFITATGTDVGKTYVSGLLVKMLRNLRIDCGYYKPVLSGALKNLDGSLFLGDAEYVIQCSGLNCNAQDCVSYSFEEPVSPHLASKRQNVHISIDKIIRDFENLNQRYEFLVIEGAGGITCPFDLGDNMLLLPEVIKVFGCPIIIVADAGLGTINNCLLTAEYAKSCGFEVVGFILNNYDEKNFMHIDNKIQVEKLTNINVLATVSKNEKDLKITDVFIKQIVGGM